MNEDGLVVMKQVIKYLHKRLKNQEMNYFACIH
jgi:hypothetical protein